MKFDAQAATWAIVGDAEEYRMGEGRREISRVLEDADEPLGPKDITAMLNERGQKISYGAVREMLSQMVKDGQAKNLGRGAFAHPDYRNCPDIPDIPDKLTFPGCFVRMSALSGMSGQSGKEEAERCIDDVPGGCWLCRDKGGEG